MKIYNYLFIVEIIIITLNNFFYIFIISNDFVFPLKM